MDDRILGIYAGKRVLVTGAGGFLGKHVCRALEQVGAVVIRNTVDLLDMTDVGIDHKADLLIHLAADVRGSSANSTQPYRFFYNNALMSLGAINLALAEHCPIVAAGSVCAYPVDAPLPFWEPSLWDGKPERSNLGYGYAKRFLAAGLECCAMQHGLPYAHLISANLYGPGDNFGSDAHVIPDLIKRFHHAKADNLPSVTAWGSGLPTRDFLYVEDAADAYLYAGSHLLKGGIHIDMNISSGVSTSIKEIAEIIACEVGFDGEIVFDKAKPDGQMARSIDNGNASILLSWMPTVSLLVGIERTYQWYKERM